MQGTSPSTPGGMCTKTSLSTGSPRVFLRTVDENEKRVDSPRRTSKECCGMADGTVASTLVWRLGSGHTQIYKSSTERLLFSSGKQGVRIMTVSIISRKRSKSKPEGIS